jgi:Fur family ferric uptake transcriptional regulator
MERKQGYQTKNRQMILDCLKENKDKTVSVSDIIEYMDNQGCAVNKTTVYRYLDKLVADEAIMKYVVDKGEKAGYQYVDKNSHCSEHLHLQCAHCGRVIHLDCEFMTEIAEHIRKDHGFQIECKDSILYGICNECSKER